MIEVYNHNIGNYGKLVRIIYTIASILFYYRPCLHLLQ